MIVRILFLNILLSGFTLCNGQSARITKDHSIGWYNIFSTIGISPKVSLHAEYQWRRNDIIETWQQSLLRLGINYKLNPRIVLRAGYGLIETYPYGDIPLNAFGKKFTEHRIFEMIQLSHRENKLDISHRFMLEQRFVGRYSSALLKDEDEFPLLTRIRYMLRLQLPLTRNSSSKLSPYIAGYDEIFIGFGKNVANNIYDQNRFGLLAGIKLGEKFRFEAGFINQNLQLSRRINDRNVYQNNSGLIVNNILNL